MALIFRAYYALIRNPRITSKGKNTNAQFGFTNTLIELINNQKPSHMAVCFDTHAPTERHTDFADYKANRQEAPEDLIISIPDIKRIIQAFNIPIVEVDGYEADDVVGTLSKQASAKGYEVFMVTPDKDYGQLVSEKVKIYKPGYQGGDVEIMGPAEVCEKWNIKNVSQVIDILGLMGVTRRMRVFDDPSLQIWFVIAGIGALIAGFLFPRIGLSLGGGLLGKFFGAKPKDPATPYLERIEQWARRNPFLGVRVYRTAAGLRGLIANELFDPTRGDTVELLQAVGSDPLYVRLCQAQGCFRARLTPKPWRCDMDNPPGVFPLEDAAVEADYRRWVALYEATSASYAVCKPVAAYGPRDVHPEVADVLAYHDRLTVPSFDKPLA